MRAVILCGGKGTRFNDGKPGPLKPLIKVNGKPILRRVIDIYKKNKIKDFILLGGYKFEELKKFSYENKDVNILAIFTGLNTNTGGRLFAIKKYINKGEIFLFTYGDSLAEFKLKPALKIKKKNNFIVSTFDYKFMYGVMNFYKNSNKIMSMEEKKKININAGFYILDDHIFKFIKNDKNESFEKNVINRILLSKKKNILAKKINKWFPMDNIEDKKRLEKKFKKNFKFSV